MANLWHSLRYTPAFALNGFPFTEDPSSFIEKLYEGKLTDDLIIVEETASNLHYHILIRTDAAITTIRTRIKKYAETDKFYCLKKQNGDYTELEKAKRYLFKGQSRKETPIVIVSPLEPVDIESYKNSYWNIYETLVENKSISSVEKYYQYLKTSYTDVLMLEFLSNKPLLATQIQYSRIKKQLPPLPLHSLKCYIQYIILNIQLDFKQKPIQKSLLEYYTLIEEDLHKS